MPSALVPLATTTLASSSATVSFSSISGAYRDLRLVVDMPTTPNSYAYFQLNNDTGANYNWVMMGGNGSSAFSVSGANDTKHQFTWDYSNGKMWATVDFQDYSVTDKHKTSLVRGNGTDYGVTTAWAQRWASTSAITSIKIYFASGNIQAGSTFSLYGVSA